MEEQQCGDFVRNLVENDRKQTFYSRGKGLLFVCVYVEVGAGAAACGWIPLCL